VGHDRADEQSLAYPAIMTSCADCHDGVTASRECDTCHVGDIADAGGGTAEFDLVRLEPPTTCQGCHSLEGCTECHGIEMPHPPGWGDPRNHARSGAFDTDLCVRCHDEMCSPCHSQIHTSHVPDWRTGHRNAERVTCPQCHDETKVGTDMCTLCHDEDAEG
jgi:hypothetical protein